MHDKYKVDSQKIAYFPGRIAQWLSAGEDWEKLKNVYPIYMEVSPSGGCNHRCIFCAVDYLGYKSNFLDYKAYLSFLKVAAEKGVKSIMFGGEGEPFIHPKMLEMSLETKKNGIDIAFTTNGALMSPNILDQLLEKTNWIKISLDAATPRTHALIHGTKEKDFEKIISNLKYAIRLKRENNYKCSLGVQLLLLPQNINDVFPLAQMSKDLGIDYFVVKPYSQGLYSNNKFVMDYREYVNLAEKINSLSDESFSAVFRTQAFKQAVSQEEQYKHCLATPFFWAYLMTNGDIYSCSVFLGKEEFKLGNINEKSFNEIWEGEKRKMNWELVRNMPTKECRVNCRMDKVNAYLGGIKNPPDNYTFI